MQLFHTHTSKKKAQIEPFQYGWKRHLKFHFPAFYVLGSLCLIRGWVTAIHTRTMLFLFAFSTSSGSLHFLLSEIHLDRAALDKSFEWFQMQSTSAESLIKRVSRVCPTHMSPWRPPAILHQGYGAPCPKPEKNSNSDALFCFPTTAISPGSARSLSCNSSKLKSVCD